VEPLTLGEIQQCPAWHMDIPLQNKISPLHSTTEEKLSFWMIPVKKCDSGSVYDFIVHDPHVVPNGIRERVLGDNAESNNGHVVTNALFEEDQKGSLKLIFTYKQTRYKCQQGFKNDKKIKNDWFMPLPTAAQKKNSRIQGPHKMYPERYPEFGFQVSRDNTLSSELIERKKKEYEEAAATPSPKSKEVQKVDPTIPKAEKSAYDSVQGLNTHLSKLISVHLYQRCDSHMGILRKTFSLKHGENELVSLEVEDLSEKIAGLEQKIDFIEKMQQEGHHDKSKRNKLGKLQRELTELKDQKSNSKFGLKLVYNFNSSPYTFTGPLASFDTTKIFTIVINGKLTSYDHPNGMNAHVRITKPVYNSSDKVIASDKDATPGSVEKAAAVESDKTAAVASDKAFVPEDIPKNVIAPTEVPDEQDVMGQMLPGVTEGGSDGHKNFNANDEWRRRLASKSVVGMEIASLLFFFLVTFVLYLILRDRRSKTAPVRRLNKVNVSDTDYPNML